MAKIMDPILPILSFLGYWSIILGSFGGPGMEMGAYLLERDPKYGPLSTFCLEW